MNLSVSQQKLRERKEHKSGRMPLNFFLIKPGFLLSNLISRSTEQKTKYLRII